jgi:hypothetical protein
MQFLTAPDIRQATLLYLTPICCWNTHAEKYADRVKATYEYMRSTINFMDAENQTNVCKMKTVCT